VGLTGDIGCTAITTFDDSGEAQPVKPVTVKLYVPDNRPGMVVLVPEPVIVTSPGIRFNVHVPLEGNPLNMTLPVETIHVGCVIAPTTGADGLVFTVNE